VCGDNVCVVMCVKTGKDVCCHAQSWLGVKHKSSLCVQWSKVAGLNMTPISGVYVCWFCVCECVAPLHTLQQRSVSVICSDSGQFSSGQVVISTLRILRSCKHTNKPSINYSCKSNIQVIIAAS